MQTRLLRILLVFCISVALARPAGAQDASRVFIEPTGWSIGTNIGTTDLWGDVGTQSILDHYANSKYTNKICFMGGMFGRYQIHPALGVRLQVNYGTLYATDAWNYDQAKKATTEGNDALQRYLRAQNAKDNILENTVLLELTPFRMNPESRSAHKRGQLFLGAGVSVFHFTPYSTAAAGPGFVKTYDLHLEGQGFGGSFPKQYSLWQMGIPLVIGYRWDIGQHLNLGIEYMYRLTFTDYLDGVSNKYVDPRAFAAYLSPEQAALAESVADKERYYYHQLPNTPGNMRGNPGNNDSYSTVTITFFYKVLRNDKEWWH